jgi:hypothetical protein
VVGRKLGFWDLSTIPPVLQSPYLDREGLDGIGKLYESWWRRASRDEEEKLADFEEKLEARLQEKLTKAKKLLETSGEVGDGESNSDRAVSGSGSGSDGDNAYDDDDDNDGDNDGGGKELEEFDYVSPLRAKWKLLEEELMSTKASCDAVMRALPEDERVSERVGGCLSEWVGERVSE